MVQLPPPFPTTTTALSLPPSHPLPFCPTLPSPRPSLSLSLSRSLRCHRSDSTTRPHSLPLPLLPTQGSTANAPPSANPCPISRASSSSQHPHPSHVQTNNCNRAIYTPPTFLAPHCAPPPLLQPIRTCSAAGVVGALHYISAFPRMGPLLWILPHRNCWCLPAWILLRHSYFYLLYFFFSSVFCLVLVDKFFCG
uniref:Uncharacterized protein n=1 Tax=Physcomitrium patens TaxID=3218 RepID=A0A2K1IQH2_PHYPA|nr:hypothetical protein PHYPA_025650 [Physcomitrium patens]